MQHKTNAFESGVKDATRGQPANNPYTDFSPLWAQYNMGYNRTAYPSIVTDKKK